MVPLPKVELAYAGISQQVLLILDWTTGQTVRELIQTSNLLEQFPEVDLKLNFVGIYGRLVSLDTQTQPGDRVEIYRPLKIDPKQARRNRAAAKYIHHT